RRSTASCCARRVTSDATRSDRLNGPVGWRPPSPGWAPSSSLPGGGSVRGMRWRRRVPQVQVVTRHGCHLCQELVRVVEDAAGASVPVTTLDLDAALASGELDEGKHARWTTLVPVLLVDGREVAHLHADKGLVRRALRRSRPADR